MDTGQDKIYSYEKAAGISVLVILFRNGPSSFEDIVENSKGSRMSVSQRLKEYINRGYLTKISQGRSSSYSLTKTGHRIASIFSYLFEKEDKLDEVVENFQELKKNQEIIDMEFQSVSSLVDLISGESDYVLPKKMEIIPPSNEELSIEMLLSDENYLPDLLKSYYRQIHRFKAAIGGTLELSHDVSNLLNKKSEKLQKQFADLRGYADKLTQSVAQYLKLQKV